MVTQQSQIVRQVGPHTLHLCAVYLWSSFCIPVLIISIKTSTTEFFDAGSHNITATNRGYCRRMANQKLNYIRRFTEYHLCAIGLNSTPVTQRQNLILTHHEESVGTKVKNYPRLSCCFITCISEISKSDY